MLKDVVSDYMYVHIREELSLALTTVGLLVTFYFSQPLLLCLQSHPVIGLELYSCGNSFKIPWKLTASSWQ